MTSTVRLSCRAGAGWTADRSAEGSFGRMGLGEVSTTGALPRQAPRLSSAASAPRIRKVVTRCAQWQWIYRQAVLARAKCKREATARTGWLDDAFARQWRRRRCVVENNRTAISIRAAHECRTPPRPPPRADRRTNDRRENSVASCAQSVLLTAGQNATQVPPDSCRAATSWSGDAPDPANNRIRRTPHHRIRNTTAPARPSCKWPSC